VPSDMKSHRDYHVRNRNLDMKYESRPSWIGSEISTLELHSHCPLDMEITQEIVVVY
jgi:hypothetical protein